jgi:hypothetical protein
LIVFANSLPSYLGDARRSTASVHAVVLSRIEVVPVTSIKTRLFAADTVAETFDVFFFAAKNKKTLPHGKVFLARAQLPPRISLAGRSHQPTMSSSTGTPSRFNSHSQWRVN